jgi:hypothetical protein
MRSRTTKTPIHKAGIITPRVPTLQSLICDLQFIRVKMHKTLEHIKGIYKIQRQASMGKITMYCIRQTQEKRLQREVYLPLEYCYFQGYQRYLGLMLQELK